MLRRGDMDRGAAGVRGDATDICRVGVPMETTVCIGGAGVVGKFGSAAPLALGDNTRDPGNVVTPLELGDSTRAEEPLAKVGCSAMICGPRLLWKAAGLAIRSKGGLPTRGMESGLPSSIVIIAIVVW
mmetsp:Transcript_45488/g.128048  ORF Transcript_45488/g.128048 Transcript_45488/m.128048 type:complete len:128 (+) Transcript_45488:669-1052(+)